MAEKKRMDFCTTCRKDTTYTLEKININKIIKDKEYNFSITAAVCDECGEAMAVPGLIDKNIQEIDEQYRAYENLVSIDEIEKLMKIYKIGKAPLSLALGFGEVTITRYLSGQIPSKEYSDIIRAAISSPSYMKQKLLENKGKIASAAYNKSMEAATQLENLFLFLIKCYELYLVYLISLKKLLPLCYRNYFILFREYLMHSTEHRCFPKPVRLGYMDQYTLLYMICSGISNTIRLRMPVSQSLMVLKTTSLLMNT